ncbi:bifunctional adenosylcobinamide kinase/adenosylcobinamide-phosphate guanylyltransferase [Vogesella facilis]|uniref:Bifunctional adenosylcobalamin biosynthesis protein n=1 Tax=Vogesella facilis TaxID=1655232 RepID=A0ABV7RFT1_9NEIS
MQHLITGGARSGKSRFAEQLALAHAGPVRYVATAERRAGDEAFAARIAQHQSRRPAGWQLHEPGRELAAAIATAGVGELLLVDCIGMWLMRFFGADGGFDRAGWQQQRDALLAALAVTPARVLLVSNEIGWGVVPLGEETRVFVDELGWLNQALAAVCQQVTLVACGQPLCLKGAA